MTNNQDLPPRWQPQPPEQPAEPLLAEGEPEKLLPPPRPLGDIVSGLKPRLDKHPVLTILSIIIAALLLIFIVAVMWFRAELSPVSTDTSKTVNVTIESGTNPPQIATLLVQKGVIRSVPAFDIYTRLSRSRNSLQAGSYLLKPSDSTQQIVQQLQSGKVSLHSVQLQGPTVSDDVQQLTKAFPGTSADTILNHDYLADSTPNLDTSILNIRPAGASLEGFIFPDTYKVDYSASPTTVVTQAVAELGQVVKKDNLEASYRAHGLTLYEGITLASIVMREDDNPTGEQQIAQVFYNRLAADMPLGSDVTFQYGAKLLGVAATPGLDSPYNTRINAGLPPTPIANPNEAALVATANPTPNNYLFFLAGDDGKLHFATTQAGHEENVQNYCKKSCLGE